MRGVSQRFWDLSGVPGGAETVRAFAIFAGLLTILFLVAGRLAFQDLSRLATYNRLSRAQDEAQRIAEAVATLGQDAGGVDFDRIRKRKDVVRSIIAERFTGRPYLLAVEVRDRFGAPILVQRNEAPRPRAVVAPDAAEAAATELVRVVQVPIRPGPQPSGEIRVAVSGQAIEREVEQARRSFRLKVAVAAAIGVGTLIAGLFYVLHLIRKNRALEQLKISADRAAYKGVLASGLAHEIRNPLNAMNINLQMLEEELQGLPGAADAEWQELLGSTKSEIKRLERLVNNFLQYARPAAARFETRDVNELIRATAAFLQADFRQSGVRLELDLEPLLPTVEIDESQLKQALMNILVNARQVLHEGGGVVVRSRAGAAGEALVEIADDGPGIKPEAVDKIFEPFFSQRRGGTGLGLAIARLIVERHGGRIEVETEVDRGTTFRIRLPRRQIRTGGSGPESAT